MKKRILWEKYSHLSCLLHNANYVVTGGRHRSILENAGLQGSFPFGKERERNKMIKQIWNWITGVLVGLVVLLALALVGVRLVGLHPYVVLSGSMEPTYPVGSLIYVKPVDYQELQVGDPITYMLNEDTVVTHRIIEVLADEEDPDTIRYFTKGDANEAADGTSVHYKNIIGKPVFSVPYLGYVSNYIQNPPGTYLATAAGAFLILLVFLPDIFSGKEDAQEKGSGRGKRRKGKFEK